MAITSMIKTASSTKATTSKAKPYHSNLDDLLVQHSAAVVSHSPPKPIQTGRTFAFSFSTPSSLSNQAVIDNTDYNFDSLGESLLLDAFYENLLRKNASRAVKSETGEQVDEEDDQQWPRLHFDVTKLAAVTTNPSQISDNTNERCPTVTKKRIDQRETGDAEQYNHVAPNKSTNKTPTSNQQYTCTTIKSSPIPTQKMNGQTGNRKWPNSPHANSRHKVVRTEQPLLNFRYENFLFFYKVYIVAVIFHSLLTLRPLYNKKIYFENLYFTKRK